MLLEKTYFLNYNLSTGFLYHDGAEFQSLRKISILTAVVNVMNCDEAVEEFRNLYFGDGPENFNIFPIVGNKLGVLNLPLPLRREFKVAIRLVSLQILSFLSSLPLGDKSLFFGKFVFNCQGVINHRKTVRKVLSPGNSLSLKRKFDFMCVYVFERDLISNLYNFLTLEDLISYWFPNHVGSFEFLIFYWILRIPRHYHSAPIELQQRVNQQISNSTFFLSYLDSPYCTEIGAQYLFEHLSPPNFIIRQAIRNLLPKPGHHRFNISMYLMFQLREYGIFNRFSYEILTNLLANPRWHDCFTRYFSMLMCYVKKNMLIKIVNTAITEMAFMTEEEGKDGKSFSTLKDIISLIPKSAKQYIEKTQPREYACAAFNLFKYHEVELICILLFHGENIANIGDKFYELAKSHIDLFIMVYNTHFNNNSNESFLRKLINSEERFLDLLTRIYISKSF
ncbi:UNVERIFIED_CONTAM: hypothetical protein RMT77_011783 [Armadillidium vulgare]